MSEMVERLARALCDALHPPERMTISDDPGLVDSWRMAECRGMADIVLAAMREPTEDMCLATDLMTPFESRAAWQAMLDEARKD